MGHHGLQGFYYDSQLTSSDTSITLHANTELDDDFYKKDAKWVEWGLGKTSKWLRDCGYNTYQGQKVQANTHLEKITDFTAIGNNIASGDDTFSKAWSSLYGAIPIASAILSEDYQIEVQNNWTDVSGQDTVSQIWNTVQQMAPLMGNISAVFGDKSNTQLNPGPVQDYVDMGVRGLREAATILNNHVVMQGNKFSMYQGTSSQVVNLNMRFTLFSDWDSSGNRFVDVRDKINMLLPYFQGRLQMYDRNYIQEGMLYLINKHNDLVDSLSGTFGIDISKYLKISDGVYQWTSDLGEKLDNVLANHVGFQEPPAGYIAVNRNIDACQRGTFRLVFGGKYALENLIGQNMSVTMSKGFVKNPVEPNKKIPMYADVNLNFKCCSSWSNTVIRNFINGVGSKIEGTSNINRNHV